MQKNDNLEKLYAILSMHQIEYTIVAINSRDIEELERKTWGGSSTIFLDEQNHLISLYLQCSISQMNRLFHGISRFPCAFLSRLTLRSRDAGALFSSNALKRFLVQHRQTLLYLDVSRNALIDLPEELQNLTNLQSLNIGRNCLATLPEWLQNLMNLQFLNASGNTFSNLPEWLKKLTNLQSLDVSNNQLATLPEGLQKLTNLRSLNVSFNQLRTLPTVMQNLTNLFSLNVGYNQLHSLPDGLQNIQRLQYLYIMNNPFQTLPYSSIDFLQRTVSFVDYLTVSDIPPEIVHQGWEAIRQHYAEQDVEATQNEDGALIQATELKLMIIGAGDAGKTSISRALQDEDHDESQASTVGIELHKACSTFRGKEWRLHVWDFGGQAAYAAMQTLFMTEKTLYIVVADARTEAVPDTHLHYIKTFAPESPILLVINKDDQNDRADFNRQVLLEEYPQLHAEMPRFSCVKNREQHVQNLFREIETILFSEQYHSQLQTAWRPRWLAVKNWLTDRLEGAKSYIELAEYERFCLKKYNISEDVADTIRKACDTLGIAFSHIDKESTPSIKRIFHPKWVTDGINHLLKLPPSTDIYTRSSIHAHMEAAHYVEADANAILAILERKSLVHMIERQFFIPGLLPMEIPENFPKRTEYADWSMADSSVFNCEFRFRYPFLHPAVKQVFMVKLRGLHTSSAAFRFGISWADGTVSAVMMEESNDLAFYLKSENISSVKRVQAVIETLMSTVHTEKNIRTWEFIHVFRTKDEKGRQMMAEYSHRDFEILHEMGISEVPLAGIKTTIPVASVLNTSGTVGQQNTAGVIMYGGITYMGDHYSAQQVGIQGRGAGTGATVTQTYNNDINALLDELSMISSYLRVSLDKEENIRLLSDVTTATTELTSVLLSEATDNVETLSEATKSKRVMKILKTCGKGVYDIAQSIGCNLAARIIASNLGL